MPGSFGTTNTEDGAIASTGSSAKSGIFARNDGTNPAPAGTPGGNGVFGLSTVPNASGVFGVNNNEGVGVAGNSDRGDGMQARTASSAKSGIFARNDDRNPAPAGTPGGNGVFGVSTVPNASGVFGVNNNGGVGVAGNSDGGDGMQARTASSAKSGIFARNDDRNPAPAGTPGGNGVFGLSTVPNASGVFGANNNGGVGVAGSSDGGDGMQGTTRSSANHGVFGRNDSTDAANAPGGSGVFGLTVAPGAAGVFGANNNPAHGRGVQGNGPEAGVGGFSISGVGVIGQSNLKSGVVGTSQNGQGLTAFSDNDVGIFARGATFSGVFEGALVVSKGPKPKDPRKLRPDISDINGSIVIKDGNLFVNSGDVILGGADCAEEFDIIDIQNVESGTVMVITKEGALRMSDQAYDKKVAGVISGAGNYKSGLVLDKRQSRSDRKAIALIGKVYCKADAEYGAIEVGDLLTTSPTLGHAMKADVPKAFGAVLGKALSPLQVGRGIIPILIALQ